MLFQGQNVTCFLRDKGIAEIKFDLQGESVNKLNQATLLELEQALIALEKEKAVKGLLVTSGKGVFIVGADIDEFLPMFQQPETEIVQWLRKAQGIADRLEDLPFPSVAVLNGYALGGGMEVAMACTYRVCSTAAVVGQPEVKLGLIPGFGGTVRLPRLIGVDNAIELIASGRDCKPPEALKFGLVQAVVEPEKLEEAALKLLEQTIENGKWEKVVAQKKSPVLLNGIERIMAFMTAKGFVAQQAGPNYPAPVASVVVMEKASHLDRDEAMVIEAEAFARLAKTPEAESLINIFHADQFMKKLSKGQTAKAQPVKLAAVLGAGIMGGGVAYQSASKGVPILMKDIRNEAIEQGLGEASRLLSRQVERGRLTQEKMATTLNSIQGTLSYGDFGDVDVVVEAVVENLEIKKKVLAETEEILKPDAILATNTSTIPIDLLAQGLKRPKNFCGMHFFNPVHRMPLVEVIRGKETSDEAIATVVAYALKMGKTPVVVRDCAGFLVNRILAPYMGAFQKLVIEGAPIEMIDKTMEKFGWPMGPAYLSDVVGLDTARHAGEVMAKAYANRMDGKETSPTELLYQAERYGQKNGKGYYEYTPDRKGRPQKKFNPDVLNVLKPGIKGGAENISGEEIVERMMLPMVFEAVRCLEEGIVDSPTELDVSLIFGIGFPPFRGGLIRYADRLGAAELVASSERYSQLGGLYEAPEMLKKNAADGSRFYK